MKECMDNVRKNVPLVHNITNYVTVNDVANYSNWPVAEARSCQTSRKMWKTSRQSAAAEYQYGTLHQSSIEGMLLAGKKANELGHPVLLDPVGAGASRLRTDTALRIMKEIKLTVIRGNISEIKTLAYGSGTTKGVDADVADAVTEETLNDAIAFVKNFCQKNKFVSLRLLALLISFLMGKSVM